MSQFIYRNKGGQPIRIPTTNVKIPNGGPVRGDLRTETIDFLKTYGIYKVVEGTKENPNRFQKTVPNEPIYDDNVMEVTFSYSAVDNPIETVKEELLNEASLYLRQGLSDGFVYTGAIVNGLGESVPNPDGVRVKVRDKDKIELHILKEKLADGTIPLSGWKVGVGKVIPLPDSDAADALLSEGAVYTQELYRQLNIVEVNILNLSNVDDALILAPQIKNAFNLPNRWSDS